jgi:hypothetical protein
MLAAVVVADLALLALAAPVVVVMDQITAALRGIPVLQILAAVVVAPIPVEAEQSAVVLEL